MKVVIVGGVAGGATAAARLRRLDEHAEIIIIERTGYVSYANCGLPYYVGGIIEDRKNLTLQTPESFKRRFNIDVRVKEEVLSIDPQAHTVRVRRLGDDVEQGTGAEQAAGDEYTETYDKLILSPGARAIVPDVPGICNPRIRTLRTVEDALALRDLVEQLKQHGSADAQAQPEQDSTPQARPLHAVVVGGGFIGLEAAENLMAAGCEVTIVQRGDHVLPPLDYDMACFVHSYLRSKGIDLRLKSSVVEYAGGASDACAPLQLKLADGGSLAADLVLLAVGVTPDTVLAREAGLELGAKDSIIVDGHMRTSAPDIYAVGDAIQVGNFVSDQPCLIPLAGPANKQGRIAADNICGLDSSYKGSLGSSVIKIFDMAVASTGLCERSAKAAGIAYDRVVTFSASHATYYPGATNMTLKMLFDPETGRVLGAQAVGFDGVDKRMDVIATAIHAGMTVDDLTDLDLSYAPPFSSAKDPVNMAGFAAQNVRDGLVQHHHWDDLGSLPNDGSYMLLDVRTPGEYARGHLRGAVNIPVDDLREHLGEIDPSLKIYVNCQSGLRSYIACRILAQEGYDCSNLSGGYRFYENVASAADFDETPSHPCGVPIDKD